MKRTARTLQLLRHCRARLAAAGGTNTRESVTAEESQKIKDRVEEHVEREMKAMSRIACYPHRSLTRPVLHVSKAQVQSPTFMTALNDLCQTAEDLQCVSFSAPKIRWDSAVILIKGSPDDKEYDVWVNPMVPGYDDRTSVAPMYGMWENCVSCGMSNAWVVRPQRITCKGWDQHGNEKVEVLEGLRARGLMHELDHLCGKTILQQALGPEFVVSGSAMSQRDLWPANFPSAEAFVTPPYYFFDYVQNTTVVPKGLEYWIAAQSMQQFDDARLA